MSKPRAKRNYTKSIWCKLGKAKYIVEMVGRRVIGVCTPPKQKAHRILVAELAGTKRELVALIHEMLHAQDWSKPEEEIDRSAEQLAEVLWKFGYRRKK